MMNSSMDRQHELGAWWACSVDMQHINVAWTCSLDMEQGNPAWTCSMNKQHGQSAWTSSTLSIVTIILCMYICLFSIRLLFTFAYSTFFTFFNGFVQVWLFDTCYVNFSIQLFYVWLFLLLTYTVRVRLCCGLCTYFICSFVIK